MIFRQLFDRESCTYTYLVGDEGTRRAALIDPVIEHVERDLRFLKELDLTLSFVLETHVHADHVTGAGELRRRTGAKTAVGAEQGPACADIPLKEGDLVTLGGVVLRAVETPGHTASCMSYVIEEGGAIHGVTTGDALLVRGCGRTDFQSGDAGTLFDSVTKKLFALPDATPVYPGHDYGGRTMSTIIEEKRHNPRLGGDTTRDAFIVTMASLNLAPPAKIHEALPANMACGERPAL